MLMDIGEAKKGWVESAILSVSVEDGARTLRDFKRTYEELKPLLQNYRFKMVRGLAQDLALLHEMLVDPSYTPSWNVTAPALLGLSYFECLVESTPNVLPVLGYIDDTLVISYLLKQLSLEMTRYREGNSRFLFE
jgi:uncharacterized membrane protein YkvA (DUF1232 family)